MPQYRIFHLDGAGRVSATEWLEAAGDETATGTAKSRETMQWELWQGRRLVAKRNPEPVIAPRAPAGEARARH
jgi:hypothetical protein